MPPIIFLYLLAGLVLLVFGADVLVRGAARLATQLGISPLIVGLTIVAFGTSAPEIAVSVQSVWAGSGDLAIGNVVGSNITNILLILGLTALITPLSVSRQLIRLDVLLMIGASLLVYALAWDGTLDRLDSALLFTGILIYVAFQIGVSRRNNLSSLADAEPEVTDKPHRFAWMVPLWLIGGGLLLVVGGSNLLVEGAIQLAWALGLSELIIGLTIVAFGTSLPELATSLVAAFRGERDIAVGNIIGSNLFNLLAVLGLTALTAPAAISVSPNALTFDFPVMIAVAIACLPIFFSGYRISRWEGALLFCYYVTYAVYLVLFSTGQPLAATVAHAMLNHVLPLTAIVLLGSAGHTWYLRNRLHAQ